METAYVQQCEEKSAVIWRPALERLPLYKCLLCYAQHGADSFAEDVAQAMCDGLHLHMQDLIRFGNSSREYVLLHERSSETQ